MENSLYMLDTNISSYIIKGRSAIVAEHLTKTPMARICISAITEAELLLGVAKLPDSRRLSVAVNEFLLRVAVLPWDSDAANVYAELRTECENEGKPLGNMDMLIASHSVAANAILVTNDKAFFHVKHLVSLADWTVK